MHAALDGGAIVGGAGAFSFRMTVPGGARARLRGRDGRRRPADPPPPRDPPLDDARPARRRRTSGASRSRRCGRPRRRSTGATATASPRSSLELEIPQEHGAFRPGDRAGRQRPARRAGRGGELFPPVYDARPRRDAGHVRARPGLVGAPRARRPGGIPLRRRPEAPAPCSRSTASRRRTRSTGCTSRSASLGPETTLDDDRGDRRDARRRRPRSGATCSTSTGRRRSPRACCRSTTRCSCCSPGRTAPRPTIVRRALGAAGRRRRCAVGARRTRATGAVVLDVRDEFCPWNAGPLAASARRRRRAPTRTADLALDVADLGSRVPRRVHVPASSRTPARVEELREGAIARADALFRTDVAPWCPEIF